MKIGIVGCGWLGLPLAEKLASDYEVVGTTTTNEKLSQLEEIGVVPIEFAIEPEPQPIPDTLRDADLVVLTIPPDRSDERMQADYAARIRNLLNGFAEGDLAPHIVYTSSTGVYPSDDLVVTEDTVAPGESARSDELRATAQAVRRAEGVLAGSGRPFTILRLAGLFGPGRSPGRFFAGKTDMPGPEARVNFVHRDDVIGVIREVIRRIEAGESGLDGEILNVCADVHPTRRDFYVEAARVIGQEVPTFDASRSAPYKIVSNSRLKNRLGYDFLHPDPLRALTVAG